MIILRCKICQILYKEKLYRLKKSKYCSHVCYWVSKKGKIPASAFKKGQHPSSKTEFKAGKLHPYFGKSSPSAGKHWKWSEEAKKKLKKEKHYRWIKNRTKVKQYWKERNNPEYKQWRLAVLNRDKFRCVLSDEYCKGKVVAHHILNWTTYIKLRYEINNGITLCHIHHPRKRIEEEKMISKFKNIISSMTTR